MKYRIISSILFCLLLVAETRHARHPAGTEASTEIRHIVFDIDWTLVSNLYNQKGFVGGNVVGVGDELYRVNDYALELIEELIKHENVRISFYSAGKEVRNIELLKKLKLPKQKTSLFDLAFKVLHYDDLAPTGIQDESVSFALRFKKDLSKISEDFQNMVMIDDDIRFAIKGSQERSFLWTGTQFLHFDSFSKAQAASVLDPNNKFIPKTYQEWSQSRLKLAMVGEILNRSLEDLEGDRSFAENVFELSKEIEISQNNYSTKKAEFLNAGNQWLGAKKSLLHSLDPDLSCRGLLLPLL
ncbi:MAG: hypothetical protein HN509_06180 [Halobacteriovoraceae bacterium]|jgi:hypothetical protein|nr:hypothetical protein [Halobacteriovoraceae bacterium]MBT5094333.1 hypothetical protein [Halobacteriovoraceae bacterium]